MDESSEKSQRNRTDASGVNPNLALILKYLAGGVLFGTIVYFTGIGKIDIQTYLIYVSSILSVITTSHLIKKNPS